MTASLHRYCAFSVTLLWGSFVWFIVFFLIPSIIEFSKYEKIDLHYFSNEMIESTSTLVRTESVKSRQSNNTTTSNDSVSYLSQYSNKKVFRSLSWVTCDGAVWQFICSFTFTCTLLHCIFNLIMISRVYGTASVVLRMNSSWTWWSSSDHWIS